MSRGLGPTRSTAPGTVQAKQTEKRLILRMQEVWLCLLHTYESIYSCGNNAAFPVTFDA